MKKGSYTAGRERTERQKENTFVTDFLSTIILSNLLRLWNETTTVTILKQYRCTTFDHLFRYPLLQLFGQAVFSFFRVSITIIKDSNQILWMATELGLLW
mmetsp:Transcript_3382/g.5130  ORF Transcript_3382/g.5130 Transcript_3382/m.5130 type:complete len:100 (+) Transcript_3382:114-413(+)